MRQDNATITQTAATTSADHWFSMNWPRPHQALTERKTRNSRPATAAPTNSPIPLPAFWPGLAELGLGQSHLLLHQRGHVLGEVTHHLAQAAPVRGLQSALRRRLARQIDSVTHRMGSPRSAYSTEVVSVGYVVSVG